MDFGNVFTEQVPAVVWCHFTCKQARNQLGTPWGPKSFLRVAQFVYIMSNSLKDVKHIFSRGENNFHGSSQ